MDYSSAINDLFVDYFPFEHLSAETRNMIYEEYMEPPAPIFHDEKPYPVTLRINQYGELALPSLSAVSRQMRYETRGYVHYRCLQALKDVDNKGLIHAQIMDYDTRPLFSCLELLSRETDVPMENLLDRTLVTPLGVPKLDNVLDWVTKFVKAPSEYPIFSFTDPQPSSCPKLNDFGPIELFSGRLSLLSILQVRRRIGVEVWNDFIDMALARALDDYRDDGLGIESFAAATKDEPDLLTRIVTIYVDFYTLVHNHKSQLQRRDNFLCKRNRIVTIKKKICTIAMALDLLGDDLLMLWLRMGGA
ncbi:hypothetical protein K504DRAFT_463499 [Pleomassaria siparia CBS 279.74]|uniref:Uncharacterized protein n=1 Tax=Pleomassaria siparia CBS 279.74 TaxID=1314801 RepID=A0A6G1JT62_9PLEO|nr:hypothetical protein K504DRAFT_463499 [Pleomassaria siparia CBS 279.74]